MIPLRDENPSRTVPFVNYFIILANVMVFVWQITAPQGAVNRYLMIPADITGAAQYPVVYGLQPAFLTIFTAMFMHGGLLHIAGNMLYLWIFGDNVEDMLGHARYFVFYIACGFAAAGAQIFMSPDSTIPSLGASGAIAGVLGAYLVTHAGASVLCIVTLGIFWQTMWLPAWLVLGGWFLLQVLEQSFAMHGAQNGGVAYMAHIGGFIAGAILFFVFGGDRSQQAPVRRAGWGDRDGR